ncbi:hypothetical protein CKO12_12720 [Chromatium okenii]|uniref:DUF29 domain-containing protein n=1 Tax=Chromatium okenii TaxID=61644 RepID=UPI001902D9AA|nr:DUF29 domain-containing protein [Chromatium okenii]MBK1642717.1 hypothetical protein [Chromatium okenii]
MTATHYNEDFFLWTQQQAMLLRQGQLNAIDAANLAEEIDSMGKRDRRALTSHLVNLLLHLLKWDYQPERRGISWQLSIRNARQEIELILNDSPSLRQQLATFVEMAYPIARRNAADETQLPLLNFSEQCLLTIEQIISNN